MPEGISHMFFESKPQEPKYFEKEGSPEIITIKPALTIVAPENLVLEKEKFRQILFTVLDDATTSLDTLRSRGIDYTGKKVYPNPMEIKIEEVRGTEHSSGWNGIVEDIGIPVSDRRKPYTLQQTYEYAQRLLEMAKDAERQDELNREISGIDLVYYPNSILDRTFLIDADGRSRAMVLKALANSGCYVSISGVKVGLLE